MAIDSTMGVNTWVAFAGSDENAVVDGDFVVTENDLRPALKSLRKAGINIVAIHSHMIGEEPRVVFFHYWDAVQPKASPKVSRKLYRPRLRHQQNLGPVSGKNVGFCYKISWLAVTTSLQES